MLRERVEAPFGGRRQPGSSLSPRQRVRSAVSISRPRLYQGASLGLLARDSHHASSGGGSTSLTRRSQIIGGGDPWRAIETKRERPAAKNTHRTQRRTAAYLGTSVEHRKSKTPYNVKATA